MAFTYPSYPLSAADTTALAANKRDMHIKPDFFTLTRLWKEEKGRMVSVYFYTSLF